MAEGQSRIRRSATPPFHGRERISIAGAVGVGVHELLALSAMQTWSGGCQLVGPVATSPRRSLGTQSAPARSRQAAPLTGGGPPAAAHRPTAPALARRGPSGADPSLQPRSARGARQVSPEVRSGRTCGQIRPAPVLGCSPQPVRRGPAWVTPTVAPFVDVDARSETGVTSPAHVVPSPAESRACSPGSPDPSSTMEIAARIRARSLDWYRQRRSSSSSSWSDAATLGLRRSAEAASG